jgi:hypothetical protein
MSRWTSLLRRGAGLMLIALGVLGVLLPVMPGIPLLAAGLALIGADHPLRRACMTRLRRWRIISARSEDDRR